MVVANPPIDHDLAMRTVLTTELHRALASRILARWTGTRPAGPATARPAPPARRSPEPSKR